MQYLGSRTSYMIFGDLAVGEHPAYQSFARTKKVNVIFPTTDIMRRIYRIFTRIFTRSKIQEPISQPRPQNLSHPAMPPKSLLRHLFRDLQPRINSVRSSEQAKGSPAETPITVPRGKTATPGTTAAPFEKSPSYAHAPATLEDISEEQESDSTTVSSYSTDNNNDSSKTFAELDLDASSATTRQLLDTAIHEAKTALQSHLESLATTIALLEALDGFSQTITVLKEEMLHSQEDCRSRLRLMVDFPKSAGTMYSRDASGEAEDSELVQGDNGCM